MNKYTQNFIYLLIPASFYVLIFMSIRLINNPSSWSTSEITPFIIGVGVLVACLALAFNHQSFILNQQRSASEDYLKNSIDLLSKAYETLSSTKDDDDRPLSSRINWLTAARLVNSAKNVSSKITERSHKLIWVENKEYWRGRFSDLINPGNKGFPKNYYASDTQDMIIQTERSKNQDPLSLKSIVFLYRFAEWDKQREGSLNNYKNYSNEEIEHMITFGPKGLGELLKEYNELMSRAKDFDPDKF